MSSSSSASLFPLTSLRCLDEKTPCPDLSYLAVSVCIYNLPAKKHKSSKPPEFLSDFSSAKRLFVSRLPETATQQDVEESLSVLQATRSGEFPLRVLCSTHRGGRKKSVYVLVAPSEDLRKQWYSVLLWSISPLYLLKKAFLESVPSASASVPAAGPSGATETSSASLLQLKSSRLGEASRAGAQAGLWMGTTAPSVAAVAGVATEAASRALGGVSVVGPALQVVNLAANCARRMMAAELDKVVVKNLHTTLINAGKDLEEVASVVLQALESAERDDEESSGLFVKVFVEGVVEALASCWEALVAVELHMMDGWARRVCNADQVEALAKLVDKIRERVRRELLTRAVFQMRASFQNSIASMRTEAAISNANMQAELTNFRDRFERLEKKNNTGFLRLSEADSFCPSFATVPALPRRVVRDGCPDFQKLKSFVLSCGSVAVTGVGGRGKADPNDSSFDVLSAQGEGGLGKTTACLLVAHDPEVRRSFPGGVYFLPLTPDSRDADVASDLAHIVDDAGGGLLADKIKRLPQSQQMRQAVDIARKWFSDRRVLIVVDNIWRRRGSGTERREWAPTLAPIAESPGSAFLFSTRDRRLSKYAEESIEFDRLDIQEPVQRNIAQRIFERYAGIYRQEPTGRAEISEHNDIKQTEDSAYLHALPAILSLCDGWPLAIEAAGAFARNHHRQWTQIVDELSRNLVTQPGDEDQRGLEAIWEVSISNTEKLSNDPGEMRNPVFCEVNVCEMRELFGTNWLTDRVAALSVFDAPRAVPVSALAVQHGTSLSQAAAFLRLCDGLGFGKLLNEDEREDADSLGSQRKPRKNITSISLALHDLQFSFVQRLCASRAGGALSSHEYHRRLLLQLIRLENCGDGSENVEDWSDLVKRSENAYTGAREYFARKLSWHFCNSFRSNSDSARQSNVSIHQDREWSEKLYRFLCDFRWIQFSGARFGRQTVLESWSLFIDTFCQGEDVDAEPGECKASALSKGAKEAVRTVFKVIEATSGYLFLTSSKAACCKHGTCDSGLAAQLEGRLSALSFEKLSGADQENAFAMVQQLLESVRVHAARPRLSPRGQIYEPVDEDDLQCTLVRYGGHGPLNAVSFIECPGRCLVASGCGDGAVRIHDMDSDGETVAELSAGYSPVVAISVRGSAACTQGALIAAAFFGGTIRVWRVLSLSEQGGSTNEGSETTIESALIATMTVGNEFIQQYALLKCVSLCGNGGRVAAGFMSRDPARRQGGDKRLYAVNVWTLGDDNCGVHSQGDEGTASGVLSNFRVEPRQLSLLGHQGDVKAVWISQDGETVVSGSHDGFVRVWRVPTAPNTNEDYETSHVIDVERGHIWCLAVSKAEESILVGTGDGCVSILCPQSGKVRGRLSRGDEEEVSAVFSMALAECTDREVSRMSSVADEEANAAAQVGDAHCSRTLLCGHGNGTISQWGVEEQMLSNEYGTPWVGSGIVLSLAAQAFEDGDGARKVHLVSGYADGRLRRWDTDCEARCQREVTEQSRRETRSVHHIPRGGGAVFCAQWSPGNSYLVFGRQYGRIELWSVANNSHVCSLFGHEACIQCFDFTQDDKLLGSADGSTMGRVWDISRKTCVSVLRSPEEGFSSILFVGGREAQIMTGGTSGSICLWNTKTAECMRRFDRQHSAGVQALSVPMSWEGLTRSDPLRAGRESRRARRGVSGGRFTGPRLWEGIKAMTAGRQAAKGSPGEGGRDRNAVNGDIGSEAVGISRDVSGLRRVWNLHSGTSLKQMEKPANEDTGLLLPRELSADCVSITAEQYREARNMDALPRISVDGEQRIGAEYSFIGDGQTELDRVLVSFPQNSYDLDVHLAVAGAPECRCQMRLAHDKGIWRRSIVCRARRLADGRPSVVVGCVDVSFKVILVDVLSE